jgi:hypothetical protein
MVIVLAFVIFSFLPLIGFAADDGGENRVFSQLVDDGIEVDGREVKLSEPTLSPAADEKAQAEIVRQVAGKKHRYEDFVRRSPVAPILLETKTLGESSDPERAQKVDVWFVAYGKLGDLTSEDLFQQLIAGGDPKSQQGESQPLTDAELRERKLSIGKSGQREESYFRMQAELLDKVTISGISHGMVTQGEHHVLAASLLDSKFRDDPDYPNRWRPIVRAPSGKTESGKPHPYAGLGGYCLAVELSEPKGALFIECHLLLNEPHGWFNGANLLSSKMPILMQDNVRTLRRKLARPRDK